MNETVEVILSDDNFKFEKYVPESGKYPNGANVVYKVRCFAGCNFPCYIKIFACEYDGNNCRGIKGKFVQDSEIYIEPPINNKCDSFNTTTINQAIEYVKNCEKSIEFYESVINYLKADGFSII